MIAIALPALAVVFCGGCVRKKVNESVAKHTVAEGSRFAREVSSQSPFETVEMSWSQASRRMRERNRGFIRARAAYERANEQRPVVKRLTREVKDSVEISFGEALDTESLLAMLNEPVTEIPKQLASLAEIKDIAHSAEGKAWEHTANSIEARLEMREQRIELHRLLRTGALLDRERDKLEAAAPLPEDAGAKFRKSFNSWRKELDGKREDWLGKVRDFFEAEYGDVRFIEDGTGLPTYRDTEEPDFTEWKRWCKLERSGKMVGVLKKSHRNDQPVVPGSELVTNKLAGMFGDEDAEAETVLETDSIRGQVRELIRHWREMKQAQEEADRLKSEGAPGSPDGVAAVKRRRAIFEARQREIKHLRIVWMMDEQCWD